MKLKCHKCNHEGEVIIKMGGLICRNCRVILVYPGEKEYTQAMEDSRKEKQNEAQSNPDALKK